MSYPCRRDCGKIFSRADNRKRHEDESRKRPCNGEKEIEIEEPIVSLTCSNRWCSKTFKKKSNKLRHEVSCRDKSSKDRNQCFICKTFFTRQTHLRRHMAVHTKKKSKKVKKSRKPGKLDKPRSLSDIFSNRPSTSREPDLLEELIRNIKNVMEAVPDAVPDTVPADAPESVRSDEVRNDEVRSDDVRSDEVRSDEVRSDEDGNIHFTRDAFPEVLILDDYGRSPFTAIQEQEQVEQEDVCVASDDGSDIGVDNIATEMCHHMTTAETTLSYIRHQIHLSKRSIKKKIATAQYIIELFGEKIDNPSFFDYLYRNLYFESPAELSDFLKWAEKDYSGISGRQSHKLDLETAQKVVDFWKDNSIVSVDRRNDRHQVRVHPHKCHSSYRKIVDENITIVEKTGKYQGHRHIYTKSVRKLHKIYLKENPLKFVSRGLFHQLKPFYIGTATQNEMLSCLCIKCQNIHGLYEPLKRNLDEFPESLTEYLTQTIKCEQDPNLSFCALECIKSECTEKCELTTSNERTFTDKGLKKYYTFERIPTFYFNKCGKKVEYIRTTRVDKYATLDFLYESLRQNASEYLKHRHSVVADKVFWTHMHETLEQPYIHLDYSQNIALKPKHEAQSMHFSGKEQTLHCTVLKSPEKNHYIYHLSDDTIHDCTMTFFIIESIIQEHPYLVDTGKLVIKSDNCATQYKSKKTFEAMKRLASRYSCDVFWFYGEAGHGRGLVDAMSSFGCKKLLKDTIIAEDVWFKDAGEMVDHLRNVTALDGNKEYHYVDQEDTAARRRKSRKELKREGCMSFCLMAVNSLGQWMVRETLSIDDENAVNLIFDNPDECYDSNNIKYVEYLDEENEMASKEPIPDEITLPFIYEVITPSSFVGLRSESEALEQFYVVEVVYKALADDYIQDSYNHHMSKGQPYLCVNYLEKSVKSTKSTIKYSRSKTTSVYVNVGEIFATNIEMADNLTMSAYEYQCLLAELFN